MDNKEIALNLTLCAMEHGHIKSDEYSTAEKMTTDYAQKVADFYNAIYSKISTAEEFTVQT